MKRPFSTLFAFALALVATLTLAVLPATAGTPISHADTGLTLELPEGWTGRGGDVVSVKNDDETAFVYFWGEEYSSAEDAAKNIENELGEFLQAVKKKGKIETSEIGGQKTATAGGIAKVGEFKVVWTVTVVESPQARVGILLGFADKETWKTAKEDYAKVVASIGATADEE